MNNLAVEQYIEALKDRDKYVRREAAEALKRIGVPALIEAVKDENWKHRWSVGGALGQIGDSQTLPRKILAIAEYTAPERIMVLDALRSVPGYRVPKTRTLCQAVLAEQDADARIGAEAVLDWMDKGGGTLVRGTERPAATDPQELVRASQGGVLDERKEILLRASGEPDENAELPVQRRMFLDRIFPEQNITE